MSNPGRTIFPLILLLGAALLAPATLFPQTTANTAAAPAVTSVPVHPPGADATMPPKPTPALPLGTSPIAFFRQLLLMEPAEREQALTNRTPENRATIVAKIREYQALKPNERDLRLSVTELRWYLRPLMTTPLTNRPAMLAMIPEPSRGQVERRLREWDLVAPEAQAVLLGLEPTLQYFTEIDGLTEKQRLDVVRNISPGRQKLLEKGIEQWHGMSEEQRRDVLNHFNKFFQLTTDEKDKVLTTLSEPERQQIERTLKTFGSLPPTQRAQCIRSFAKFTNMSIDERQQFLKNAERWKQMSPTERQAWRQLVSHLPPPLPRRPPPLPPSIPRALPGRAVVTNGT